MKNTLVGSKGTFGCLRVIWFFSCLSHLSANKPLKGGHIILNQTKYGFSTAHPGQVKGRICKQDQVCSGA